jgi:hypothetical protein
MSEPLSWDERVQMFLDELNDIEATWKISLVDHSFEPDLNLVDEIGANTAVLHVSDGVWTRWIPPKRSAEPPSQLELLFQSLYNPALTEQMSREAAMLHRTLEDIDRDEASLHEQYGTVTFAIHRDAHLGHREDDRPRTSEPGVQPAPGDAGDRVHQRDDRQVGGQARGHEGSLDAAGGDRADPGPG